MTPKPANAKPGQPHNKADTTVIIIAVVLFMIVSYEFSRGILSWAEDIFRYWLPTQSKEAHSHRNQNHEKRQAQQCITNCWRKRLGCCNSISGDINWSATRNQESPNT